MLKRAEVELTDRVHDQCEFETSIAHKLRVAAQKDRMQLYSKVYNEYGEKFPESLPRDSTDAERNARYEAAFLRRFVTPSTVVAEIGPGRCHLSVAIAPLVGKIYGVDVSDVGAGADKAVPNFELRQTDGIHMPFDSDSIDLVISNQLMEHLHPDDAYDQLREIYRVLREGGSYICVTPSRLNGPHDCSAYFDDLPCPVQGGDYMANGLHLKEYTTRELVVLFNAAGFKRLQTFIGARGRYVNLPPAAMNWIETAVRLFPADRRKRSGLLGAILGNRVCATK
nr:class I SAM-dependent methyltransferase [uncultured Rhodopila sp.]